MKRVEHQSKAQSRPTVMCTSLKLKTLDCQRPGPHNGSWLACSPFCAPMKPELTKRIGMRNYWRSLAGVLTFSLLVSFALIPAAAQLKPRRITSVWTTTTAEGSHVTVDADAPVNDYESYKRGDRFYIRIPLSDLPSTQGSLLGRGFDDVQIHRYGDGILLSFRLRPGTTARVDQKANRLDVIFSTPGRSPSAALAAASHGDSANRTRPRRTEDISGPTPPSSAGSTVKSRGSSNRNSSRETGTSQPTTTRRGHKATPNASARSESTRDKKRNLAGGKTTSRSTGTRVPSTQVPVGSPSPSASASPSPVSGAAPIASASVTPTASPYNTPTPSLTPVQQTASSSTPAQTPIASAPTSQATDWASWKHYVKVWVILNWLPLLVGSLIVLCLLVLLLSRRRAQKRRVGTVKQVKEPVPQG